MPIKVRVRNFQSIEDATVVIKGFTVITGPNNCGKTALMRAIRGVFTNAPPGPLVRHGCTHLIVDLTFDDGTTVKWEKGTKVNRYTLNGKLLENVGRGVPPEIESLGIRPIQAGTEKIWPQIADQFSGVLFLINTPGSVMAEAVADVDRVGKLSSALKLSETDRRSAVSTLKIRRQDSETLQQELDVFTGLDQIRVDLIQMNSLYAEAEKLRGAVEQLQGLKARIQTSLGTTARLEGVPGIYLPSGEHTQHLLDLQHQQSEFCAFAQRIHRHSAQIQQLEGVSLVYVPGANSALVTKEALSNLTKLRDRVQQARALVKKLEPVNYTFVPEYPTKAIPTKDGLFFFKNLRRRIMTAQTELNESQVTLVRATQELAAATLEVDTLIQELGVCPTCRNPMCGEHHG